MNLENFSKEIRKSIVTMNANANVSHSGSALSIVDILSFLYFKGLNIDPMNPSDSNRDIFILSKGHASSALYSTLAIKGFFDKKLLDKFYVDNGVLPGHLDKDSVPGVEVSAGSLGHGLSIGLGMAIAKKVDKLDSKVVVLCGDGELNEGSVWEAIMFAPNKNLDNLTLIVDYNKYQGYGSTNEVINMEPLNKRFESFGWEVCEIDGHDFSKIEESFYLKTTKPKVIIAHTIKGKGVSYMENQFIWHYKSPNDEELAIALEDLK